jgi:HPt (histidine-containing phosphotransfer) domain-containing protein
LVRTLLSQYHVATQDIVHAVQQQAQAVEETLSDTSRRWIGLGAILSTGLLTALVLLLLDRLVTRPLHGMVQLLGQIAEGSLEIAQPAGHEDACGSAPMAGKILITRLRDRMGWAAAWTRELVEAAEQMAAILVDRKQAEAQVRRSLEAVEETAELLAETAHSKGLELVCEIAPEMTTALRGDVVRLRQVLNNLISNAIKFTEQGEIVVCLSEIEGTGKPNILQKVIHHYLENTPVLLQNLHEAIENNDTQALRISAHTLKSSSANLGALALSEHCKVLESMGRENHMENAQKLLAEIEANYIPVASELQCIAV